MIKEGKESWNRLKEEKKKTEKTLIPFVEQAQVGLTLFFSSYFAPSATRYFMAYTYPFEAAI
jgi:hypothetical protein